MAQKWKLPLDTINAILNHHLQDTSGIQSDRVRAMVAMVQIANTIVNEISLGSYISSDAKNFLKQGKNELMLNDEQINDVRRSLLAYGL